MPEEENDIDENGAPSTPEPVPYERFKEVNEQKNALETRIKELETKKETPGGLNDAQQKELEAKQYLKGLLKETLSEEQQAAKAAEEQEQKQFERQVSDVLGVNPDVEKKDFVDFLEKEGDDYASVDSAMRAYKRINEKVIEAKKKTREDEKRKPDMPSHEGGGGKSSALETDKGKTISQIADEVIRGMK